MDAIPPKTLIRDTKGLRAFLVEQMNAAATGQVDVQRAKAITNYAQQIYNTLNIELKSAVVRSKIGDVEIQSVTFDDHADD